jgi:hypothetical protein
LTRLLSDEMATASPAGASARALLDEMSLETMSVESENYLNTIVGSEHRPSTSFTTASGSLTTAEGSLTTTAASLLSFMSEKGAYMGDGDPFGLFRSVSAVEKSLQVAKADKAAKAAKRKPRVEKKTPDEEEHVSAVDRSLRAVKRKTRDEEEHDMDVLKLIGSNNSANTDEAVDQFVVNPFPRKSFFGFLYKNAANDTKADTLAKSFDVSIDPARAAGTPLSSAKQAGRQARLEECKARSPKGRFLRKNETPSGSEFLQMNVTSAAHTGKVLDDLGKSERDWKGQLDTTMSASAATPRVGNTATANTHRSRANIYQER